MSLLFCCYTLIIPPIIASPCCLHWRLESGIALYTLLENDSVLLLFTISCVLMKVLQLPYNLFWQVTLIPTLSTAPHGHFSIDFGNHHFKFQGCSKLSYTISDLASRTAQRVKLCHVYCLLLQKNVL